MWIFFFQKMRQHILRRLFREQHAVTIRTALRSSQGVHRLLQQTPEGVLGDADTVQAGRVLANDEQQHPDSCVEQLMCPPYFRLYEKT